MADEPDRPDQPPQPPPPPAEAAKKASPTKGQAKAAKKAPNKGQPKKSPAKKAPPKKAPPASAPKHAAPQPPEPLADTNGDRGVAAAANETAAHAKHAVDTAGDSLAGSISRVPGTSGARLPIAVALALSLLAILLIRRLRSE